MRDEAAIQNVQNEDGRLSLNKFIETHGRLPFVTDDPKPWDYQGWLLPYRIGAEAHPVVASRYDYVIRTKLAGKLLDEPLPQIEFIGEGSRDAAAGLKQIEKMIGIIEHRSSSWNTFRDICEWLGFALGVTAERPTLAEDLQDKLYRFFNLEPWLLFPTDYLGEALCQTSHGRKNGYFPTPMTICTMLAKMTFPDGQDCRHLTAHDPAVGSGRTLLAASNYSMRLFGQDNDPLVVLICKINFALYAPWHHIPESVFPCDPEPKTYQSAENGEKTSQQAAFVPEVAIPRLSAPTKKRFTTEIEQPTLFGMDE